ncbi:ATP-binding protein [Streptomyces sp. HPF1205]|uniref:ATP-binding protein n=1 Tax=Streptomyces sp. HPF1205 TaxID=2873262 RepID=UPI001CED8F56|nr:ATP-binding protein [Streptomyces sp. HPF1205]
MNPIDLHDPPVGKGRPEPVDQSRADGTEVVRTWPAQAHCVGSARSELRRVLAAWDLADLASTAELVLSELVTNAVRHGHSPRGRSIETRFLRLEDAVRVEVHDGAGVRLRPCRAGKDDESGRGLALVDVLTDGQWGVTLHGNEGKAVWALIRVA